jgi:sugar/nucleoside kinase (ribokinase family)
MIPMLSGPGAFAALLLVVAANVSAQTGAFVVRLGTDTIAVERFQRTGDRVEGTVVRHTPTTNVVRYTITLNADGTVNSYRQAIVRAMDRRCRTPPCR